jgi:hypothetical protein
VVPYFFCFAATRLRFRFVITPLRYYNFRNNTIFGYCFATPQYIKLILYHYSSRILPHVFLNRQFCIF